jgi:hypothetical protein
MRSYGKIMLLTMTERSTQHYDGMFNQYHP